MVGLGVEKSGRGGGQAQIWEVCSRDSGILDTSWAGEIKALQIGLDTDNVL